MCFGADVAVAVFCFCCDEDDAGEHDDDDDDSTGFGFGFEAGAADIAKKEKFGDSKDEGSLRSEGTASLIRGDTSGALFFVVVDDVVFSVINCSGVSAPEDSTASFVGFLSFMIAACLSRSFIVSSRRRAFLNT
jgi:hypothetical protein